MRETLPGGGDAIAFGRRGEDDAPKFEASDDAAKRPVADWWLPIDVDAA